MHVKIAGRFGVEVQLIVPLQTIFALRAYLITAPPWTVNVPLTVKVPGT